MLDVAQQKSGGMGNLRWVQGDMRSFDLGERFGLAIIPGHSFQNILTPEDQCACLRSGDMSYPVDTRRAHRSAGGGLVRGSSRDRGGVFETTEAYPSPHGTPYPHIACLVVSAIHADSDIS